MAEHKNKKRVYLVIAGCFILAVIVAIISMSNIFKDNVAHVSDETQNEKIGILECTSANPLDAFFTSKRVVTGAKHEIRVTFSEENPDKLSYLFTGAFEGIQENVQGSAQFQADYNNYMASHDISASSLYPTFNTAENEFKIVLFADRDTLNLATSPIFFLNEGEYKNFFAYTPTSLRNIYRNKGFSCNMDS